MVLTNNRDITKIIGYFGAAKGEDDIHFVLNGTSCRLSTLLCASNFWLPDSKTITIMLSYDYKVVDVYILEMFLNFPLHKSLHMHSGMDLTLFRKQLLRDSPDQALLLKGDNIGGYWLRTWFGLRSSPEQAAIYYYVAEEFIRGNWKYLLNPLRWDRIVLNLLVARN